MDVKCKEKLIEALQSDKYLKDNTFLKIDKDKKTYYSLMGVFCDLFKDKLNANWILNPFEGEKQYYFILGQIAEIPKILSDKFRIKPVEVKLIKECQEKYKKNNHFREEIKFIEKNL